MMGFSTIVCWDSESLSSTPHKEERLRNDVLAGFQSWPEEGPPSTPHDAEQDHEPPNDDREEEKEEQESFVVWRSADLVVVVRLGSRNDSMIAVVALFGLALQEMPAAAPLLGGSFRSLEVPRIILTLWP